MKMTIADKLDDWSQQFLDKTMFAVEATSFEQFSLWKDHANGSADRRYKSVKWEQMNPGCLLRIGSIGDRPCCISLTWARIERHMVVFWHSCSQVTDSVQAEKWFEANFKRTWDNGTRRAMTDAQNFHHCLHAIEEQLIKEAA